MMMKIWNKWGTTIFVLLCFAVFTAFINPHKFYTSITQIAYNENSKSAEIIMNVFADDLEQALTKFHHRKISMSDAEITSLTLSYLQSHFSIKSDKFKSRPYQMIGVKLKEDIAEIYLEQAYMTLLPKYSICQNILIDDFENQVNVVNVAYFNQKASLVFKKGQEDSQKVLLK